MSQLSFLFKLFIIFSFVVSSNSIDDMISTVLRFDFLSIISLNAWKISSNLQILCFSISSFIKLRIFSSIFVLKISSTISSLLEYDIDGFINTAFQS
jgi:hypothetical protein